MKIATGSQYMDSLKKLKPVIYYQGERIHDVVSHPATAAHVRAAAMTYYLAQDPEYKDLATAVSHLTGRTIGRFTHVHQNADDLIKKAKLLRVLGQKTGTCFQRCVGFDGINAVYSVTYEMDRALGTDYFERFNKWLTYIQDENLMVVGAMTDPKGDRSKGPAQQADPDQFLHIVKRRSDGVVIRGAKLHMTGAVNSHEILIMPTTGLNEDAKDYAVICALPVDAPGVTMIFGRQANDSRRDRCECLDAGKPSFGTVGGEALIAFEDVFVPWDRVFMAGETEFRRRGGLPLRGSPPGQLRGLQDRAHGRAHRRGDLSDHDPGHGQKAPTCATRSRKMIHLCETLYSSSLACACEGWPTDSGAYMVDTMLANVCKQNVTRFHFEVARLALDLAGGFIATLPGEKDLASPEVGRLVEKYLSGIEGVPTKGPHQAGPPHRSHDRRDRPGGIHARRGFAPGSADHDLPGSGPGPQNGPGQKAGPHPGPPKTETGLIRIGRPDIQPVGGISSDAL